jgi:hypothetical protein
MFRADNGRPTGGGCLGNSLRSKHDYVNDTRVTLMSLPKGGMDGTGVSLLVRGGAIQVSHDWSWTGRLAFTSLRCANDRSYTGFAES